MITKRNGELILWHLISAGVEATLICSAVAVIGWPRTAVGCAAWLVAHYRCKVLKYV